MTYVVTLPSGLKLSASTQDEWYKTYFTHSVAALSERMCPLCSQPVAGTCFSPVHRPTRWHLCPDRENVTESYLDVPLGNPPKPCDRCGNLN